MNITTGIITGTGFYTLPNLSQARQEVVPTPYGNVEAEIAMLGGREIALIARHGKQHTIAPAEINFRANIFALKELGVKRLLASSVCGSLVWGWGPGSLVLIDQFLNYTSGRAESFYPFNGKLMHIDVTDPYCATLHTHLLESARDLRIELQRGATYACMNGPRFENRAEINRIRQDGGHLVGHTNFPECVLAREQAICYATVGVVSNYAAGMASNILTATEIMENLQGVGERLAGLFAQVILSYPEPKDCACQHSLDQAAL